MILDSYCDFGLFASLKRTEHYIERACEVWLIAFIDMLYTHVVRYFRDLFSSRNLLLFPILYF